MRRIAWMILGALLLCAGWSICICCANENNESFKEIYNEQVKLSGADELMDKLPAGADRILEDIGVSGVDVDAILKVTPEEIFEKMFAVAGEKSKIPLKAVVIVLAVMLFSAIMGSLRVSIAQKGLAEAIEVVSILCICVAVIDPLLKSIQTCAGVIKGTAVFMLCYIPVLVGIMIAAGQPLSASSYGFMMLFAGESISQISSGVLIPMLSIFLAVCVASAVSPKLNLTGLCNMFQSMIKWLLGAVMTVFIGILSVQTIVGAAVDSAGSKTMKFMISSFVPIIGGALSDGFSTVQSCVKTLKSGVGAFGILAGGVIFLPIIVECIVWIFSINACAVIGDIFEFPKVAGLLRNSGKVMSTMLAIILCTMTVLVISTVVVLTVGGGSS